MELLSLDKEKLLVCFGCENLEFTKRRLKMVVYMQPTKILENWSSDYWEN